MRRCAPFECLPSGELVPLAAELLEIPKELIAAALELELAAG
jgi:hypothetical protein